MQIRRWFSAAVAVGVVLTTAGCGAPRYSWTFRPFSQNATGTGTGNGPSGSWKSGQPGLVASGDGSTIAFFSAASDLGPADTDGTAVDLYVRDIATGATELVTVNAAGTDSSTGDPTRFAVSHDGSKVAFVSTGNDLVGTDTNGLADVFVRDTATDTTTLVSARAAVPDSGNGASTEVAISPDGTKVAFTSSATNLGPPNDNASKTDVFVRDLVVGQTTLASARPDGTDGADNSYGPVFSPDGTDVAFTSLDPLGISSPDGKADVFHRDLAATTTKLVSTDAPPPAGASTFSFDATAPVFSPDGGKVAFVASANYAAGGEVRWYRDLEVADLTSGTIELVTPHPFSVPSGQMADNNIFDVEFSPDGSRLFFGSNDGRFGPADANQLGDVYVRDLVADTTSVITINADGTAAAGGIDPDVSADGNYVVFVSWSDQLGSEDDPDENSLRHLYLRHLGSNTTRVLKAADGYVPWAEGNLNFVGSEMTIAFVTRDVMLDTPGYDDNGGDDILIAEGSAATG